jgi:hypothetical protein
MFPSPERLAPVPQNDAEPLPFRDWCRIAFRETRRLMPEAHAAPPESGPVVYSHRDKTVEITRADDYIAIVHRDPLSKHPAPRFAVEQLTRVTALVAGQNAASWFNPALAVVGF